MGCASSSSKVGASSPGPQIVIRTKSPSGKDFAIGEAVEMRDLGLSWHQGIVTSTTPLKVSPARGMPGLTWFEVRKTNGVIVDSNAGAPPTTVVHGDGATFETMMAAALANPGTVQTTRLVWNFGAQGDEKPGKESTEADDKPGNESTEAAVDMKQSL